MSELIIIGIVSLMMITLSKIKDIVRHYTFKQFPI